MSDSPAWMRNWLRAAGVYNLLWGAVVIALPDLPLRMADMQPLAEPGRAIWQCLGMVIGVYGVGYLCAASHPLRHWPIVLVGLLGKIFGPVGFVWTASRGAIPWHFGATILTNDLLWWWPFAGILIAAWGERGGNRGHAT
ncbi:MAG: alkyl hydroperoxide reductase [Planctomycetota bacterium]